MQRVEGEDIIKKKKVEQSGGGGLLKDSEIV